jgi:hypothetical protein
LEGWGSHELYVLLRNDTMPKKVTFEQNQEDVKPPSKPKSKANQWAVHLDKTYKAGRKKDASYLYSMAMQDAKKTYKRK